MDIYSNDYKKNFFLIPGTFLLGIAMAWIAVWFVNILQWLESITIGSLLGTLFWADARGPLYVIHTFVVMFMYVLVLPAAVYHFKYVEGILAKRIMVILMTITIIFLFDKHMASNLSWDIASKIYFLQEKCYFRLLGGASFANLTWSESVSYFEYVVFDIYVALTGLVFFFNKRSWDE